MLDIFLRSFILAAWTAQVRGEGRLIDPLQRGSIWRCTGEFPRNYQDHVINNCGGFWYQWGEMKGKCGVCGDPWDAKEKPHEAGGTWAKGRIVQQYYAGDGYIDVAVQVTSNMMGYYEFNICPNNDFKKVVTEECLDLYRLEIEGHPNKRYYPQWLPAKGGIDKLRLKIPEELVCEQCVLRWKWRGGNQWGFCGNGTAKRGCGRQPELYNCADIKICSKPCPRLTPLDIPVPKGTRRLPMNGFCINPFEDSTLKRGIESDGSVSSRQKEKRKEKRLLDSKVDPGDSGKAKRKLIQKDTKVIGTGGGKKSSELIQTQTGQTASVKEESTKTSIESGESAFSKRKEKQTGRKDIEGAQGGSRKRIRKLTQKGKKGKKGIRMRDRKNRLKRIQARRERIKERRERRKKVRSDRRSKKQVNTKKGQDGTGPDTLDIQTNIFIDKGIDTETGTKQIVSKGHPGSITETFTGAGSGSDIQRSVMAGVKLSSNDQGKEIMSSGASGVGSSGEKQGSTETGVFGTSVQDVKTSDKATDISGGTGITPDSTPHVIVSGKTVREGRKKIVTQSGTAVSGEVIPETDKTIGGKETSKFDVTMTDTGITTFTKPGEKKKTASGTMTHTSRSKVRKTSHDSVSEMSKDIRAKAGVTTNTEQTVSSSKATTTDGTEITETITSDTKPDNPSITMSQSSSLSTTTDSQSSAEISVDEVKRKVTVKGDRRKTTTDKKTAVKPKTKTTDTKQIISEGQSGSITEKKTGAGSGSDIQGSVMAGENVSSDSQGKEILSDGTPGRGSSGGEQGSTETVSIGTSVVKTSDTATDTSVGTGISGSGEVIHDNSKTVETKLGTAVQSGVVPETDTTTGGKDTNKFDLTKVDSDTNTVTKPTNKFDLTKVDSDTNTVTKPGESKILDSSMIMNPKPTFDSDVVVATKPGTRKTLVKTAVFNERKNATTISGEIIVDGGLKAEKHSDVIIPGLNRGTMGDKKPVVSLPVIIHDVGPTAASKPETDKPPLPNISNVRKPQDLVTKMLTDIKENANVTTSTNTDKVTTDSGAIKDEKVKPMVTRNPVADSGAKDNMKSKKSVTKEKILKTSERKRTENKSTFTRETVIDTNMGADSSSSGGESIVSTFPRNGTAEKDVGTQSKLKSVISGENTITSDLNMDNPMEGTSSGTPEANMIGDKSPKRKHIKPMVTGSSIVDSSAGDHVKPSASVARELITKTSQTKRTKSDTKSMTMKKVVNTDAIARKTSLQNQQTESAVIMTRETEPPDNVISETVTNSDMTTDPKPLVDKRGGETTVDVAKTTDGVTKEIRPDLVVKQLKDSIAGDTLKTPSDRVVTGVVPDTKVTNEENTGVMATDSIIVDSGPGDRKPSVSAARMTTIETSETQQNVNETFTKEIFLDKNIVTDSKHDEGASGSEFVQSSVSMNEQVDKDKGRKSKQESVISGENTITSGLNKDKPAQGTSSGTSEANMIGDKSPTRKHINTSGTDEGIFGGSDTTATKTQGGVAKDLIQGSGSTTDEGGVVRKILKDSVATVLPMDTDGRVATEVVTDSGTTKHENVEPMVTESSIVDSGAGDHVKPSANVARQLITNTSETKRTKSDTKSMTMKKVVNTDGITKKTSLQNQQTEGAVKTTSETEPTDKVIAETVTNSDKTTDPKPSVDKRGGETTADVAKITDGGVTKEIRPDLMIKQLKDSIAGDTLKTPKDRVVTGVVPDTKVTNEANTGVMDTDSIIIDSDPGDRKPSVSAARMTTIETSETQQNVNETFTKDIFLGTKIVTDSKHDKGASGSEFVQSSVPMNEPVDKVKGTKSKSQSVILGESTITSGLNKDKPLQGTSSGTPEANMIGDKSPKRKHINTPGTGEGIVGGSDTTATKTLGGVAKDLVQGSGSTTDNVGGVVSVAGDNVKPSASVARELITKTSETNRRKSDTKSMTMKKVVNTDGITRTPSLQNQQTEGAVITTSEREPTDNVIAETVTKSDKTTDPKPSIDKRGGETTADVAKITDGGEKTMETVVNTDGGGKKRTAITKEQPAGNVIMKTMTKDTKQTDNVITDTFTKSDTSTDINTSVDDSGRTTAAQKTDGGVQRDLVTDGSLTTETGNDAVKKMLKNLIADNTFKKPGDSVVTEVVKVTKDANAGAMATDSTTIDSGPTDMKASANVAWETTIETSETKRNESETFTKDIFVDTHIFTDSKHDKVASEGELVHSRVSMNEAVDKATGDTTAGIQTDIPTGDVTTRGQTVSNSNRDVTTGKQTDTTTSVDVSTGEQTDTVTKGDVRAGAHTETISRGDVTTGTQTHTINRGDVITGTQTHTINRGDVRAGAQADINSRGDVTPGGRTKTISSGDVKTGGQTYAITSGDVTNGGQAETLSSGDITTVRQTDSILSGGVTTGGHADTISSGDITTVRQTETTLSGDVKTGGHAGTISSGDVTTGEQTDTISSRDAGTVDAGTDPAAGADGIKGPQADSSLLRDSTQEKTSGGPSKQRVVVAIGEVGSPPDMIIDTSAFRKKTVASSTLDKSGTEKSSEAIATDGTTDIKSEAGVGSSTSNGESKVTIIIDERDATKDKIAISTKNRVNAMGTSHDMTASEKKSKAGGTSDATQGGGVTENLSSVAGADSIGRRVTIVTDDTRTVKQSEADSASKEMKVSTGASEMNTGPSDATANSVASLETGMTKNKPTGGKQASETSSNISDGNVGDMGATI